MVDDKKTTEELILEAALKVFQKKGLAGARMQEIADEAGINKAMLHYYFRNKDLLFKQIFFQSYRKFVGSVIPILNEDVSWDRKISALIEHYVFFIEKNPDLPLFILNELRNDPEEFASVIIENGLRETLFIRQLKAGMAKGEIRKVPPQQILNMIMSGIVFPFIAQPMVKYMASLNETDWDSFIATRKIILAEMLIKYLKEF